MSDYKVVEMEDGELSVVRADTRDAQQPQTATGRQFLYDLDHGRNSDEDEDTIRAIEAEAIAIGAKECWQPVDDNEARSVIGEGVHTGLRKGTDASGAHDAWKAIAAEDSGWSDAIAFAVDGLEFMGYRLCRLAEPEAES